MVNQRPALEAGSGPAEGPWAFEHVLEIDLYPELPAITGALSDLCTRAEASPSHAPLLIRIGGTPTRWPGDVNMQEVTRWEREVRRLERLPCMIVAAVEGVCTGPGLDVLATSDLRIASPGSVIRLSTNADETWPGMCLYRLVLQIGLGHMRRAALFGGELDVHRAVSIGLIDEVEPDPSRRAAELLPFLSGRSGKEVAIRRTLALEASSSRYEDALGVHLAACSRELRRLENPKQPD